MPILIQKCGQMEGPKVQKTLFKPSKVQYISTPSFTNSMASAQLGFCPQGRAMYPGGPCQPHRKHWSKSVEGPQNPGDYSEKRGWDHAKNPFHLATRGREHTRNPWQMGGGGAHIKNPYSFGKCGWVHNKNPILNHPDDDTGDTEYNNSPFLA